MITNEACLFQAPDDADYLWVETLQFPIVLPDSHITAIIYINVRPALKTMWLQVMVIGSLTDTRADQLHYWENAWLPAPDDFRSFTTPNGLTITAVDEPRTWRIDYIAEDGTEIHVDWEGLMEPFDIHDPLHSPQAGDAIDIHADIHNHHRGGAGHFDMSGRIRGTLTVRGEEFPVDAIERMDRSWGPRDPMKVRNMFIVSANFGDDLYFHMICPWDPEQPYGEQFELTHGYVVDKGVVYGLTTELDMTTRHLGSVCTTLDMTVTDVRGEKFTLRAAADVGAPWIAAPSSMTHNSLMSFRHGDRPGYGIVYSVYTLPWLNERRGRFHTDPAKIYC